MVYIYDRSFEGLLTTVFYVYKNQSFDVEILSDKFNEASSLFGLENIETDAELAARVWNGCKNKISKSFANEIYYLFLSETRNSGNIILNYIIDAFKYGSKINEYLHLPSVRDAYMLKNKVLLENHRFKGLLRFRKFENVYLADFRPDHNILPILYQHFDNRLPKQQWIIRDIGRKFAAIHFDSSTQLASYEDADSEIKITDEYEDIWREFYKSIAIRERTNPRLQKQFMPKRYWENIIEKM